MNTHKQIHQIAANDRKLDRVLDLVPAPLFMDTNHLQRRQQQRAISTDMIKIAVVYGQKRHDNRGGVIYMLGDRMLNNTPYAHFIDCMRGLCVVCKADSYSAFTAFWRYTSRRL